MFKAIRKIFTDHSWIFWVLIIGLFTASGLALSIMDYKGGVDFGDGSTFYSFAHNLLSGEAVYKDFIHFRMPGSYFLQTFLMIIFGDSMATLRFALAFEAQALYPLVFLFALGILLKFKKPLIGLLAGSAIILLPAYAQLRTALAFLAVALYTRSLNSKKPKTWLVVAGVGVGLAYTFGQEMGVVAGLTIILAESFMVNKFVQKDLLQSLKRLLYILLGFGIVLVPLLVYIILRSDIGNFLYYTIYYAFVLQPKAMDLVFPPLAFPFLIYFLPFAVYIISFFVVYALKVKNWPFTIFLVFAILRTITLLGRTDFGHMIFVLPEVFVLLILCLFNIKKISVNKGLLVSFVPYGIIAVIGFMLAIRGNTLFIALPVFALLIAVRRRSNSFAGNKNLTLNAMLSASAIVVIIATFFFYVLYPNFKNTLITSTEHGTSAYHIEGVDVDQATYEQYQEMKSAIAVYHPDTIFSYPIQAFYYRFAPHHATRFMTFELQTTVAEQDKAIKDLKKTHPQVVVYDPRQASDLNSALYKINDYIKQNYKTVKVVNVITELWIMVPIQNTTN